MSNQKILNIDSLSLQELDTDAELIPLMTPEDEEEMNNEAYTAFAQYGTVSGSCYTYYRREGQIY
jgi:hypothetical protein